MSGEKEITFEIPSPWFLVTIAMLLLVFYFDLQVTINSPIVFGDEGFHTTLAKWIAQHHEYPKYIPFEQTKLIKTGFYRPPLWNFLEASLFFIFGFHDVIVKILVPFLAFLLGLSTYFLVKRLYSEEVAAIAAILLVSFPSVVTYSVLSYYSMLLLLLGTISLLTFLIYVKEDNKKFLIISAIFAGLAFLTNRASLGLYFLMGFWFLYELFKSNEKTKILKKWYIPIIIALLIPSGFIARNLIVYHTLTCESYPLVKHIFTNDLCDIKNFQPKYHYARQAAAVGTEQTPFSMGLVNYMDFAYGNYWFILFGLFSGFVLMFYKKDKLALPLVVYALIFAVLFPIVTNRAEDTARYTLIWSSSFALVIAVFYKEVYDFFKHQKKYLSYLKYLVIVLVVFVAFTSARSKAQIMFQVKHWSPLFFQACSWVKHNTPNDSIVYTVWAHNAAYCSDRTIAPAASIPDIALSDNVSYTLKVLKENGIDYLWIQKFSIDPYNRDYIDNYPTKFVQMLLNNKQYFIPVYENGPDINQCLYGGCDGNIIFKINYTSE